MTTVFVLWLMTVTVNAQGPAVQSPWSAMDTFESLGECKAAIQGYAETFAVLLRQKVLPQAKCLPAGVQP